MNISFECPDKINGLLTLTVEKEDYEKDVEKKLKDYRKKANVPGFRPGMVPMGMIKRMFGQGAKEETVNRLIGEKLSAYLTENKVQVLGTPMAYDEDFEKNDMKTDGPFVYRFDVAVAPEINAGLGADDTIDFYDITVDDALIDEQVEMLRSRGGHEAKAETIDMTANDMLKGDVRELDADGNVKEGGISHEGSILMPSMIKVEEQKNLFADAKVGSDITFNPRKAYPESDAELASLLGISKDDVAGVESDFTFHVTEIMHFVKADVNQELFDKVFGKDEVKSEEEFRARIKDGIKGQVASDENYKFMLDVRAYLEGKVGELQFPDALLKRMMLRNNKDKGEKFVDDNYEASIKELKWQLIKEKLAGDCNIKLTDADLKDVAMGVTRMRFAQYGMTSIEDSYVEKFAEDMLKQEKQREMIVESAINMKLAAALKEVVKLNKIAISLDDFNKMMNENKEK